MRKRKFGRTAALATTVVATAALLSGVVATTGAYFTEKHDGGSINTINGTVSVLINGLPGNAPTINFDGLLPGTPMTTNVSVGNTGTGTEDVYLVFDNTNLAWSGVNTLGNYGTFTIAGNVYDNLNNSTANLPGNLSTGVAGAEDMTNMMAGSCSDHGKKPINYLPHYVKVAGGLAVGSTYTFDVSFGFIDCLTGPQGGGTSRTPLNFSIVAFQAGTDPTVAAQGKNKIAPFTQSRRPDNSPIAVAAKSTT